ncbi:MAG TPA: hypothetical protein VFI59_02810 [Actinomycetota bacterium]|nr:hypothetical protein [Actinomycetota bacterium]
MSTSPQVPPHEADPKGRITSDNAKEMGAKGAAKREQNLRDRVTQTRQELALLAEPAAATLGQILTSDARDADKIRAAMAILDRVGVGPHSSQEVSVGPSLVEQWAEELDALGEPSGPYGDSA